MAIHIVGTVDPNRLYCAGSFSKMLTTFISLSLLSEKYDLNDIIDDDHFLDTICNNSEARDFLTIFQKTIGSQFSIHDIFSYYAGLPYTFDVSETEIEQVDAGLPFKHHSVLDKKTFLYLCHNKISQIYPNRCKFNYSELSIIFMGYLLEKIYQTTFEQLYSKYIIEKFKLTKSVFSRKKVDGVYIHDLSDMYDLASIAIRDNGYFCYSNGFHTTLNDAKILLEGLIENPVFQFMFDMKNARAASNRLMNGLAIEMRMYQDDLIIGYDGLSFSGCNLWAYSTKNKVGYLTFNDSGDLADKIIFDQFGYASFDTVPEKTQQIYRDFIKNYDFSRLKQTDIPLAFQGNYLRVNINDKKLKTLFPVTRNTIMLRDPEEETHDIVSLNDMYRIKSKDQTAGGKVGLYTAKSGNHYVSFGGTLLKKINHNE